LGQTCADLDTGVSVKTVVTSFLMAIAVCRRGHPRSPKYLLVEDGEQKTSKPKAM
jgi:hypothetical protein